MPPGKTAGVILGTGGVVALLSVLFWLPYVHAKVVKGDYTIRFYHFFFGPALWWRPAPEDAITADNAVPDYRIHDFHEESPREQSGPNDIENATKQSPDEKDSPSIEGSDDRPVHNSNLAKVEAELAGQAPRSRSGDLSGRPPPPEYKTYDGSWLEPWNLVTIIRYNLLPWAWYTVSAGLRTDIHAMQASGSDKERARLREMHACAVQYDNKVEHLYSFMQVMTACTASFAHGANDVSNSIGPLAVVYHVWSTSLFPSSKESVPIWILAFGGAGIVIGLGTYGWRLMSVLGNRLTMHSPSRGFSMELGASITVVIASYLGLPISSTQSITGATLGVALCNGDWRAFNWKMLGWIFFSWVLTLPMAGLVSGCLFGIVLNAPSWNTPIPAVPAA